MKSTEWIPVTERVPEENGRYPFLCQPELRAAEQQTVTHWMPLPILPSEG